MKYCLYTALLLSYLITTTLLFVLDAKVAALSTTSTSNNKSASSVLSSNNSKFKSLPVYFLSRRSPLLDQLKRSNLKKELIKAAKSKDEDAVISIVEELSLFNPTPIPTLGLLGYKTEEIVNKPPLDDAWKLLFTNAQDAEAPVRTEKNTDEKFGNQVAEGVEVKTGQRINATSGECVNFIHLTGNNRPFDKLEITIQMTPINDVRVRLDFLKGRALNPNAPLPFLRDFTFNFPPKVFNDIIALAKGRDPRIAPQAYFDVLYIDDDIRAHKTGDGKLFVQRRGDV